MGGDEVNFTAIVGYGNLQGRAGELGCDLDISIIVYPAHLDAGGKLPLVDDLRRLCERGAGEKCHPIPTTVSGCGNVVKTEVVGDVLERALV